MNKNRITRLILDCAIVTGLVIVAFASRFVFLDYPNFKPITAIALFAGFYFRNVLLAIVVPLTALLVSDGFLGGYPWQMAMSVYACFAFSVWLGRRWMRHDPTIEGFPKAKVGSVLFMPLITATTFFLVTNLVTWKYSGWYPVTWDGLTACFAAAIPFYKYTLAGDLIFSACVFGCYAIVFNIWVVLFPWQKRQDVVRNRSDST